MRASTRHHRHERRTGLAPWIGDSAAKRVRAPCGLRVAAKATKEPAAPQRSGGPSPAASSPDQRQRSLLRRLYDSMPATLSSNIVAASSTLVGPRIRRVATAQPAPPRDVDASDAATARAAAAPAPAPKPRQRRRPQGRVPPPPQQHAVLELMQQRLRDGSTPGHRQDGFKLGLVVEGGGMRGIVTGAMLMGLLDAGLRDTFDVVYGASAGAINSTFFLTGQREGLDIYTDHLARGERFLSLRRYWGAAPVMDLSYLLEEVMTQVIPLRWEEVLSSRLPLKVVASSLDTLRAETLSGFGSVADLSCCLHASANVPEIVGPPIAHRGHRLVDAAVFEPVPLKSALRDGCTHALVLCSRPPHVGSAWGDYLRNSLALVIKRMMLNPPYMREAWAAEPEHHLHEGQPLDRVLVNLALGGAAAGPWSAGEALEPGEAQSIAERLGALASASGGAAAAWLPGAAARAARRGGALPPRLLSADAAAASGLAAAAAAAAVAAGSSPGASLDLADGCAEHGLWGAHVLPVFPGPDAGFAPICKDVPTLQAGRREGFQSVRAAVAPVLASARRRA